MKKLLMKLPMTGALLSASILLISNAQAAMQLDFNIAAPTSGNISYAGGNSSLIGSSIDVDNVVATGTSLHNNITSLCITCTLQFVTGPLDNYDPVTSTWSFTSGGSIEISGGIDFTDNSSLSDIAAGSTLLTGTFQQAKVFELASGIFNFSILGGSFVDNKNPLLLAYYGLPTSVAYTGGLNLSFSSSANGNGGFQSDSIYSGDIVNTPVPLPPALLLLLSGLTTLLWKGRVNRHNPSLSS